MYIITEKENVSATDFTTKYIIESKFTVKGVVETSDIVGAIFGQTEGLLLDLDLRDLQKSGRIGRIEVENETKDGITTGIIRVPSSLTRKETALLAATIETVSRVGPCEAEIKLIEIKDVREEKRKQIIERAAELLKEWDQKAMESSEIEEQIETDIKLSEIISWGPDKLPAGPDVEKDSDLIIVEGRADILNLLRIDIKNTVAVNGTQIPKSIIDLSKKKKTVTAFLDGDRGGTIILNELLQVAKIDYVARAPEGYEVEELTRKQLIKALQNKKPVSALKLKDKKEFKKEYKGKDVILYRLLKKIKIKDIERVKEIIDSIEPGYSIGLDRGLNQTFKLPTSEVFENLKNYKDTKLLIIHGVLTKRLLSLSINMKIKFIACKNKEEDLVIPDQVSVFYF
ncbi:MAG: DNA primase DnaG [Promethearchaeota archaeon]